MSLASLEQAIPEGEAILLDSTALISYLKRGEPASPAAAHIVDQCVLSGRNPATVSAVSAMELLVDPLRRGDDTLYRQVVFFLMHTLNLQLVPVDFRVAHEAAALRAAHGFKPPDALILGTGRAVPVRHLVCNDEEWKRKLQLSISQRIAVCYLQDHLPFP